MTDAAEREPLTFPDVRPIGRGDRADDGSAGASIDCNGRHSHGGEPEDIDGGDDGCANYQQPRRFQTAKYSGYTSLCTLGRVSMHDSWEFDASTATGEGDEGGYRDDASADSDSDGECDGEFVSFWRHNYNSRDSDSGDDGSFCSHDNCEEQAQPQHLLNAPEESQDEDDRVETTMRPIPLLYRKYQGGLGQIAIGDPSRNNFGSWFQRELGVTNLYFNEKEANQSRRVHWQWGFGGMRRISLGSFGDSQDEGDANSLLESSSSDDAGMCIPAQLSPLAYHRAMAEASRRNKPSENVFGRNDRRGILGIPIVKPFLRGTRRGFTDDADADADPSNEVDDNSCDDAGDWPSRRDRADVVKSIAQGIAGTTNDSLLLDPAGGDGITQQATNPPTNLLERIFLTRFLQPPGDNRNNRRSIIQLHNLLRKEDWALATTLLESKPELAQTWHNVSRLYGGRYDGEALPIHAACALRPPTEFVEMLVDLYPSGLKEKDKAFGRVSLHVACRSLADSSVIRVLCEMEPSCVEARDSLKRVPLHYHIKNSNTLGDDDRSVEDDSADTTNARDGEDDGIKALKVLLDTSSGCVHAADHRGWIPLHVACSCSSRKGMLRVMRLLLKVWPESLNATTDKGSDVFACVEMAGEHHPTKERVLQLLNEAKGNLDREGDPIQDGNSESDNEASVAAEEGQFEENERCSSSEVALLQLDGN